MDLQITCVITVCVLSVIVCAEKKEQQCVNGSIEFSSTELKHFNKPSHVAARFANIENKITKNVESACTIEDAKPNLSCESVVAYENEVKTTKSSLAACKKTWIFGGRCKKRVRFFDEIQPPSSLCERFVSFFRFLWTCTRTVTTVLSKSEFFIALLFLFFLHLFRFL